MQLADRRTPHITPHAAHRAFCQCRYYTDKWAASQAILPAFDGMVWRNTLANQKNGNVSMLFIER